MLLGSQKTDQQRRLLFRNYEMEKITETSSKNFQKVKLGRNLQRHEKMLDV